MHEITIGHNFETAHRLSHPDAPPKCRSIHGHSWWVEVSVAREALDERGMVIEFGAFKRAWRGWLDDALDHHLVVRRGDPVARAILAVQPEARLLQIETDPTTEALAELLFERAARILAEIDPGGAARVVRVDLRETRVNAASYARSARSPPSADR